jgi:hypothetical protein
VTLSPGAGRATISREPNRGVFLRIATTPPIRLWTGRQSMRAPANDLDPQEEVYYGLGIMQNIPELDRLIDGEARRVDFTLSAKGSGFNETVVNLLDGEMIGVAGSKARIGHLRFDRLWQPTSAMRWAWDGTMDEVGLEMAEDGEGHRWVIHVSMSTGMVDRNRPPLDYWTPKDQFQISATDRAFDYVPSYNEGTTRIYPPR